MHETNNMTYKRAFSVRFGQDDGDDESKKV